MKLKTQYYILKRHYLKYQNIYKTELHILICFNILKHNLRKIKLLGEMYTDTGKNTTDFGAAKSRIKRKFIVLTIIFPWKSKENAFQTPVPTSEKEAAASRGGADTHTRPAAGLPPGPRSRARSPQLRSPAAAQEPASPRGQRALRARTSGPASGGHT